MYQFYQYELEQKQATLLQSAEKQRLSNSVRRSQPASQYSHIWAYALGVSLERWGRKLKNFGTPTGVFVPSSRSAYK